MSQITCCPHCRTCFKVVTDQLRVADGWVRCGQCKQIFDAAARLTQQPGPPELAPDLLLSGDQPESRSGPQPAPELVIDLIEPVSPAGVQPPAEEESDGDELPTVSPALDVLDATIDAGRTDVVGDAEDQHAEELAWKSPEPETAEAGTEDDPVMIPELDLPQHAEPFLDGPTTSEVADADEPEAAVITLDVPSPGGPVTEVADSSDEDDAAMDGGSADASTSEPAVVEPSPDAGVEPGFVRSARRGAFWKHPVVRSLLAIVVLVLALALVVQVAVQERDVLAARYPQAQPLLQQLCVPLGCTVQAPRRIADIAIEASSFVKERGDDSTYVLDVSLKNLASTAVGMPALELTLVDAAGRAVVRRVLQPADVRAPAALDAGTLWAGSTRLRVNEGATRVTGYRVLAFYP